MIDDGPDHMAKDVQRFVEEATQLLEDFETNPKLLSLVIEELERENVGSSPMRKAVLRVDAAKLCVATQFGMDLDLLGDTRNERSWEVFSRRTRIEKPSSAGAAKALSCDIPFRLIKRKGGSGN